MAEFEEDHTIEADVYLTDNSERLYFVHQDRAPTRAEVYQAAKTMHAGKYSPLFQFGYQFIDLGHFAFEFCFSLKYSSLRKTLVLPSWCLPPSFQIILPEESATALAGCDNAPLSARYLFNILCELLISKQSRWNFIVSVVVEILEILICIVLMYRLPRWQVTLFSGCRSIF